MNNQESIFLRPLPQEDDIPLSPTCDYCQRPHCKRGTWYQLLNGKLSFICSNCARWRKDERGKLTRIYPVGYPVYSLANGFLRPIEMTITEKIRVSLLSLYGKKIKFKFRAGRRRVERIKGRFYGIYHDPQRGFVIDVTRVTINGHYLGGNIEVPMRRIIWQGKFPLTMPMLPQGKKSVSQK